MTKLDENLSEIFDVEPTKATDVVPVEVTEVVPANAKPVLSEEDREMEADFNELRQNQKDLMNKGKIALECALDIVQQSDQPRAIEVFSTLLGQMSKLNQEAMDLHEKRKKIKNTKTEGSDDQPNVTNNNAIFVGTTDEVNKMIAKLTGKKDAA
jgi:hypothetical protein